MGLLKGEGGGAHHRLQDHINSKLRRKGYLHFLEKNRKSFNSHEEYMHTPICLLGVQWHAGLLFDLGTVVSAVQWSNGHLARLVAVLEAIGSMLDQQHLCKIDYPQITSVCYLYHGFAHWLLCSTFFLLA